jgi:hypothetical protein
VAETIIILCSAHKLCTILIIIGSPDSSENPFPDMEDMEKIATNSRKSLKNRTITRLLLKIARLMLKSTILHYGNK